MGKICCLIGKSSSGKDTIFKKLAEDQELNLVPVISYTTRPIRQNEQNGIEYYFIDTKTLAHYKETGKIIERRDYETVNGQWSYCTIDDGQINLDQPVLYLLIATLEAYGNLKKYFGNHNVIPFYITVDDGIRLERALAREKEQANPNYDELCRRFLADSIDFNQATLTDCGIIKQYRNENLSQCMQQMKADLFAIKKQEKK